MLYLPCERLLLCHVLNFKENMDLNIEQIRFHFRLRTISIGLLGTIRGFDYCYVFDVEVSLSNCNKLTKNIIPSAPLSSSPFVTLTHFSYKIKERLTILIISVWKNIFMYRNYCKNRPAQTSKNIAIIGIMLSCILL